MHPIMKSLQITNNLLLVTLFTLIQKLAITSTAPMDHKNRPGNCLKQGKRVRQWRVIQRKTFFLCENVACLCRSREKRGLFANSVKWTDIYHIFYFSKPQRLEREFKTHFSTLHPSFPYLRPFTFPPPSLLSLSRFACYFQNTIMNLSSLYLYTTHFNFNS